MPNYVIYRISDVGYKKIKPSYINNENCLKNAVNTFKNFIFYIIADNICEKTKEMILKYILKDNLIEVSVGHGAGTFNIGLDLALKLNLNNEDIIYFLENDYLHRENAENILIEGFTIPNVSFITLYDHPDKYNYFFENSPNCFVKNGGEITQVIITKNIHWKHTNSTTMTFATRYKTLLETHEIMRQFTKGSHPNDFPMFIFLLRNNKLLYSPLPGYSTHGETEYLCPLVDWNKISQLY